MEALEELIRRHGLEEDQEHIIIPIQGKDGRKKRCFILKRPFLRVVYPDGHYTDFPIGEVVEAVIRYPELAISEALYLLHEELDAEIAKIFGDKKEVL